MKKHRFNDLFSSYPVIIESPIKMTYPNEVVTIYKGVFTLKIKEIEINLEGKLEFRWFPHPSVAYLGKPVDDITHIHTFIKYNGDISVFIDEKYFGKGPLIDINLGNPQSDFSFRGMISHPAIKGDQLVPVNQIIFSIPNFGDFIGYNVQKVSGSMNSAIKARLSLECKEYAISIDRHIDLKERLRNVSDNGGYHILSDGLVESKIGKITFEQSQEIMLSLSTFLTFVSGKRTSPIFRIGYLDNKESWKDYSSYLFDSYQYTESWMPKRITDDFKGLWLNYRKIWNDEDDKDFLQTAIHWYIEANTSKFLDTAIVNAQAALELLYNWWVVEQKQMMLGTDSDRISAANKIRLVVSQIEISQSVPRDFTFLTNYISRFPNILDGPDTIVQTRNAIVHSKKKNREKLNSINNEIKHETMQLSLWYIELALLKILNYSGKYINRVACITRQKRWEENVPWFNKTKTS